MRINKYDEFFPTILSEAFLTYEKIKMIYVQEFTINNLSRFIVKFI